MLDVCLLGTGGMMPLPYRWLTALLLRYEGSSLLIDCGEGTQIAMKEAGRAFKPVDFICFTPYHADHISGLPGFLLTMGNAERTEPLTIIGPRGITRIVNALRSIAPDLPFDIQFIELTEKEEAIAAGPYRIHAFRVQHNITCYGYSVKIPRAGKFQVEKARALGLPVQLWGRLQKGETVEFEGEAYYPEMVLGEPRKGLKVTYCTDTRPTPLIAQAAAGADLFICEGMYGEAEKVDKAIEHKHMTFLEAAKLAAEAGPKELWLTHFSPSLNRPSEYMDAVRRIFPNAHAGKDGRSVELKFDDQEAAHA